MLFVLLVIACWGALAVITHTELVVYAGFSPIVVHSIYGFATIAVGIIALFAIPRARYDRYIVALSRKGAAFALITLGIIMMMPPTIRAFEYWGLVFLGALIISQFRDHDERDKRGELERKTIAFAGIAVALAGVLGPIRKLAYGIAPDTFASYSHLLTIPVLLTLSFIALAMVQAADGEYRRVSDEIAA